MKKLPSFVDMKRDPEEIREDNLPYTEMPHPLYPYGLCLSLTKHELDKLDLDPNVDAGDLIHLHAIGKVTSVSKRDTDDGPDMRVEIQLTSIALEDEDGENEEAEMMAPRKPKNPYGK